ncbi:MAG: transposase [Akkermansiaceae bacterium]|nr:transposase [Akkermansiaceae bacterium]
MGGLPAAGLLAHLLVGKYCRSPAALSSASGDFSAKQAGYPTDLIVHWIQRRGHRTRCCRWLCHPGPRRSPRDYLQVDETTVRYLRPGTGKSWMGYLWQARCPRQPSMESSITGAWAGAAMNWSSASAKTSPGMCSATPTGSTETYARTRPEVRLIACLAHIRRGFVDSLKGGALPARGVGGPFDRATIPDRGRPAGAESRPRPARE